MSTEKPTTFRERFAWWLMQQCYKLVERIDRKAVPKYCSLWTFTFERGYGAVLHMSHDAPNPIITDKYGQPGAKLWYVNDWDYEKAHTESILGS